MYTAVRQYAMLVILEAGRCAKGPFRKRMFSE